MVSFAAILVSTYALGSYLYEEKQSDVLQKELSAIHSGTATELIEQVETTTKPKETASSESSETPASEDVSSPETAHGLKALHVQNGDCVAWITIDGTPVDYPVMYHPSEKDYYLYRDFNGRHSVSGSLYIAEICDLENGDNVLIYGHNMNSGKMFGKLTRYKRESYWQEHPNITLETLNGTYTYEIMYALTTSASKENTFKFYRFANAADEAEFNTYLSECASRALYDTGVTASYGDHLLTLCTCEYSQDNGRMLVVAKRIDKAGD